MAKNVTGADIFGGMFQNIPGYENEKRAEREEALQDGTGAGASGIRFISREALHPFRRHPYRVTEDDAMRELAESICDYGIKEPVLVRPDKEKTGTYEIISGHRRIYAAGLAGLTEIPVHIEDMDDDTATVLMVDSNNKRDILFPSEKAWAYRIKAEALRHQGKRNDLISEEKPEDGGMSGGMKAVGEKNGDSERTVRRYIRLTWLMQELLELVDAGKLPLGAGYMISFFNGSEQECILNYFKEHNIWPNSEQMTALFKLHETEMLDEETLRAVMEQEKVKTSKPKQSFTIKKEKLGEYFPADATQEYVESIIFQLLKGWADGRYQTD